MAGMQTELNAVMNAPGTYEGFSANYSGAGFSQMRFDFHGLDQAGFDAWVDQVKASNDMLDRDAYVELEKQSVGHSVTYFGSVEDGLWTRILNMCAGNDALCLNDMMMVDALGGGGLQGLYNRDLYKDICSVDDSRAVLAMLRPGLKDRSEEILAAINPAGAYAVQATPAVTK
ncbi:MAG: COX aromatic rich motif-containing protein, partial [Pseudomonadota bacterium]